MLKQIFKLIKNLIFGYAEHTKYEHCHDPKLLALIEDFKDCNFKKVEELITSFSSDYREFAFTSLGEVDDTSIVQKWITQEPHNEIAKLILANHKVLQGWAIRGNGTASSVSNEDMQKFKSYLNEAKDILMELKKDSTQFDINKDICLLTIFKAIDLEDRDIIHQTFEHGLSIDANHIGLHTAYFIAISEKWGGTREELDNYFAQIPQEPKMLAQSIMAIYYWDLIRVYQIDDDDTENEIKDFILNIGSEGVDENNLYRYQLYLHLYWLSSVLLDSFADKFYNLVKPYWDDKQ